VRAFFTAAPEVKTVRVAISGELDQRAASIDEVPVPLEHDVPVAVGHHELWWNVTGEPSVKYTVSLSGAATWTRSFVIPAGGEDFGSKGFDVS
jgi:hypothetical protein